MIDEKYYAFDKTNVVESDFWTNNLYNMAYDKVKDRKYPLIIPSYNRPNNNMIKYIYENVDPSEPWDIRFLVRKSQKEAYEVNEYFQKCDFVTTLALEDELINDIGKVREQAVNYFMDKSQCIFMMDDDVTGLFYTVPFMRASGAKISLEVGPKIAKRNFARVLAMWQVAMEESIKIHNSLIISCPMIAGFSWAEKYCDSDISLKFISGAQVCCLCINVDNCKKYDVNFRTGKGNGHEDKDFVIRAIQKGCMTAEYRWLAYNCETMGTELLNTAVKDRMAQQYDEMYANFPDVDFIRWVDGDRNGFKNVRINWNKAMKYYNDFTGENITKDTNKNNLAEILGL